MGRKKCLTNRTKRNKDRQRKREGHQQFLESFVYHPVDITWRRRKAAEFSLPLDDTSFTADESGLSQLLAPSVFHQTIPDGNCFFNALSFVITGHEHYQHVLRRAICNHLIANKEDLKAYLPADYDGNVDEYVARSGMKSNKTWATEVEIFTAAHMLKTHIYVYTKYGVHWKWLKHSPGQCDNTYGVYLFHRSGDHYDVVLDIGNPPAVKDSSPNEQLNQRSMDNKKENNRKRYSLNSDSVKERAQIRYNTDSVHKENKKTKQTEKYQMDTVYSKTRKAKQKEKYDTDFSHSENKKLMQRNRYDLNKEEKKSKRKRTYHEDPKKKNQIKATNRAREREKYKLVMMYRDRKKRADRNRYRTQKGYKDYKRHVSVLRYASNPQFRKNMKNYTRTKYKTNSAFRDKVKEYSKDKYSNRQDFRDKVKEYSKDKYSNRHDFRDKVKEYSKDKYSNRKDFRQSVKELSVKKYSQNEAFRFMLRASSIKRYASRPLFRARLKYYLRQQYHDNEDTRSKKKDTVKTNRKSLNQAVHTFRKNITDTPRYACTVCARLLCRTQVRLCKRSKYMDNGILHATAEKCLTGDFLCDEKEYICKTCDNHLSAGNMPPQALANGLKLLPIPDELRRLNGLEKQLVALRIPFMKLLSLPRGGQRGVKGQVVNVPSNLNSVTTSLPRTIDTAQMVKVKLKRKLQYKGHHQYEWVNPNNVIEAVKYLVNNNPWYKGMRINDEWFDEITDSDIVQTKMPSNDTDNEEEILEMDNDENNKNTEHNNLKPNVDSKRTAATSEESRQPHPVETCSQPLDLGQEFLDTNNKVFCIAPGENQTPKSIFQEKGADAMAFPVTLPDGNFGFSADREITLSPSKYFNSRLFCADDRFSKDNQFIFFAQFMIEIHSIRSNISVALRKGKPKNSDGKTITASMLTNTDSLQDILRSDTGFRFLQPVRGTPPYWQRTMKDLFAMIRQLGIPTWFITFSAAETRWDEVMTVLNKDDKRDVSDIEWTDKCRFIKDNPVMCARLFNNRVRCLFTDLIMSPARPIGKIADFFYRTEFQQRGSPHIHCLFWVEDAPKLDENTDEEISRFVDKYISCRMPDADEDPELHSIVTSVQMHRKTHTKSCRKNGSTCRFKFPRPPIKYTFIARSDTDKEETYIPKKDHKPPTAEEFAEICKKGSERSAKEVVRDVWTVIKSAENIEDYTIDGILKSANVTYPKFVESLKATATRSSVYHRRDLTDVWVNNFSPTLLRAWNANMDIQYVMDPYSCVAYILSYISKAEAELGELLSDAKAEAREGNKDAAAAMKQIGQVYIHNREVSAQEAVYRICSMHLKDCSRKVMFVPTGSSSIKMSLPISALKSKTGNSENIWMSSMVDKYHARPDSDAFENVCLAEFCSRYTTYPKSRQPKHSQKLPVYQLQKGLGFIKKRCKGKEAVIRYPRFNRLKATDEFYLSLIQLYLPHRRPISKPLEFKTFEDYIRHGSEGDVPLLEIINEKRNVFEKNVDDLEKAWDDVQEGRVGEDTWAMIAPESEAERIEQEQEKERTIMEDEETSPDVDMLGGSKRLKRDNCPVIEFQRPKMSTKEVQNCLRSMNEKQREIFYHVREWTLQVAWKKHPEPFHVFITGGAGTGKSHLIKCIYHDAMRILSKLGDRPDVNPVLLTAPTGTAAFNIGGMTLHSAFSISKNAKLPYAPLGESILNTLRAKYDGLQLLIIDEVSMVDHKLLTYIHGRLSQLKQSKKYFGNVAVMAVGDFYQLPPVRASPLYKVKDSVVLDLWNPLFTIATLTEVMRQKEDARFASMLNRLRIHPRGEPFLPEDLDMLTSVSCDNVPDDIKSALHIFPTNKEVAKHNEAMVNAVCNPCISAVAKDFYKSTITGHLVQKEQPYLSSSQADLLDEIKIGIGARVMLTRNIDTEDGLVNGAFGTITALDQTKDTDLKAVFVKFDNVQSGRKLMSKTISKIPGSKGAVRIKPVEDSLHGKNAVRKQFPLKLGWAATIHKVQGMTSQEVVVSLKKVFQPGMSYVALSRATLLGGLHILDLDTNAIYASEEIKNALQDMPRFLKEHQENLAGEETLDIILHNTEGLLPHKDDIQNASMFSDADIICFTETWLSKNITIPASFLEDFDVHTLHREAAYSTALAVFRQLSSMARGGVATFVQRRLQHTRHSLALENLEYVAITIPIPAVMLIVVYRPPIYPVKKFSETLTTLLSLLEEDVSQVIIVGDFNDNIFGETTHFHTTFRRYGYNQLVEKPTTEAGTCLDVVYVKGFTQEPKVTVQPLYYSFHDAVQISLQI